MKNFWTDVIYQYQIIHIHWPHVLLEKVPDSHNAHDVEMRFSLLKSKGVKIVTTCHNLEPHYWSNEDVVACYEIVYRFSDTIIHLGEYSKRLFEQLYPTATNALIYHHVYDTVYKNSQNKDLGFRILNLNPHNRYILCFGAFRDIEERNLILNLGRSFRDTNIYILAPSYSMKSKNRSFVQVFRDMWGKYVLKYKYHILYSESGFVDDAILPAYYSVSDIALIHRVKILNSGNVFMAMYMGKAIIGPDVGNVGSFLRHTGNVVFNPEDTSDLKDRVIALLRSCKDIGSRNKQFAMENLRTDDVVLKLFNVYQDVLIR